MSNFVINLTLNAHALRKDNGHKDMRRRDYFCINFYVAVQL
jgi:hypothetical protein